MSDVGSRKWKGPRTAVLSPGVLRATPVLYHQLENYLRTLIAQGFRVAVCEQVQDAKEAKGIVDRAVTRVLTPGTLVDESLLEASAPCRLAAIFFGGAGDGEDGPVGVAV